MQSRPVKTCALRSGSSGNSIFVGSQSTRLLIDAGICARSIEQSLQGIDEEAAGLDGILVTHEHSDHIAGVGVMMRRYKLPVFANLATWQAMRPSIGKIDERLVRVIETGQRNQIGDLVFSSFSTPHDAASPVGYRIELPGGDVSVITDIGSWQEPVLTSVAGSRIVYIEANYDHAMLMGGAYPALLKQRICSDYGHLSNEDCATAVCSLLESGTSQFVLSHLSKDNNYPELALLTVNSRLDIIGARRGRDLGIGVARRYANSEPLCF